MSQKEVAEALLIGMPIAFAFKTIVFLLLWIILSGQQEKERLGGWVNRLFFATFTVSIVVTLLLVYLNEIGDGADINTFYEWALVIGVSLTPVAASFCGIMVAYYTFKGGEESKHGSVHE